MSKRRTRLEMYFDVLEAIRKGKTKSTHIMQHANMSWNNMNSILNSLIELEIVKEVNMVQWKDKRIRKFYEFNKKGESMINYLKDHSELLKNGKLREFY